MNPGSHPTPPTQTLHPDGIRARAAEVSARAEASGALVPISTRFEVVEQTGVRFQLRTLMGRRSKGHAPEAAWERQSLGSAKDPFGPCDPSLLLGDLSDSHCCVLNKSPALAAPLLIVTRHWEGQERLLGRNDLHALWRVLQGIDGLGFYNGGREAGASQAHKHLQILPLPMHPGEPVVPMEARLAHATWQDGLGRAAGLPFDHALLRLPTDLHHHPHQAAIASLGAYHRLLAAVDLARRPGDPHQPGPYNLLVTRRWMLMIPRRQDAWQGLSINALGYAGSLLARDEPERQRIRAVGPMALLAHTGHPTGTEPSAGPADPGWI